MTDYKTDYTSIEGGDREQFPMHVPGEDAQAVRPQSVDKYPVEPAPRFPDERQGYRSHAPVVQTIAMIPKKIMGMMEKVFGDKKPVLASFMQQAEVFGENLTAVIHTIAYNQSSTGGANPFAGVAWTPTAPATFPSDLKQSIVAVAQIEFGNQGITTKLLINAPSDQFIKAPINAQTLRVSGRLLPKYYALLTAPGGSDYDFTWISTTSNEVRNNLFNEPPPGTLTANGPAGGTWPPSTPVQMEGYVARGLSIPAMSNADRSSRPIRRFFGWIDKSAAQGKFFRCPVPRGAVSVTLLCDANGSAVLAAGTSGQLLNFAQVTNTEKYYNFQPNVTYQLQCDCDAIDVYPSGGAVPAARSIPFEMLFELGF